MSKEADEMFAREWAAGAGVRLEVFNFGEHWRFEHPRITAEWWPSSGRLVIDRQWRKATTGRKLRAVLEAIARKLERPPRRITPAYVERLRGLVEG